MSEIIQGTDEWKKLKLGVISASRIMEALAKKGTATRQGYMCELVAQIATGEMPELSAKALEWGKNNEASAKSAYEFHTNSKTKDIAFMYGKDKRFGCSPDLVYVEKGKGVELKCPFTSRVHVEFISCEKIKPEYVAQCQFSMWITGFNEWDFASYDPRMKKNMIHSCTILKDEKYFERFETELPDFLSEMGTILDKLDISFGDQWN